MMFVREKGVEREYIDKSYLKDLLYIGLGYNNIAIIDKQKPETLAQRKKNEKRKGKKQGKTSSLKPKKKYLLLLFLLLLAYKVDRTDQHFQRSRLLHPKMANPMSLDELSFRHGIGFPARKKAVSSNLTHCAYFFIFPCFFDIFSSSFFFCEQFFCFLSFFPPLKHMSNQTSEWNRSRSNSTNDNEREHVKVVDSEHYHNIRHGEQKVAGPTVEGTDHPSWEQDFPLPQETTATLKNEQGSKGPGSSTAGVGDLLNKKPSSSSMKSGKNFNENSW